MVEGISVWEQQQLPIETGDDTTDTGGLGAGSIQIPIARAGAMTADVPLRPERGHYIAYQIGGNSVN